MNENNNKNNNRQNFKKKFHPHKKWNNKKNQNKKDEAVQEDININNAKIKVLEVELGSLITNYDSFIAKMNIDIKDIDKKLDKYSSVLERIESKINELTATGWTHE